MKLYAVYFDYEGDETNPFSYFIGCKTDKSLETPKELEDLVIPSQDYTRFSAKGGMTGCITDAWKQIWNSGLNRKFGFDFEVYDERSQDWSERRSRYLYFNETIEGHDFPCVHCDLKWLGIDTRSLSTPRTPVERIHPGEKGTTCYISSGRVPSDNHVLYISNDHSSHNNDQV